VAGTPGMSFDAANTQSSRSSCETPQVTALQFFDCMHEAFGRAALTTGVVERWYQLAGYAVKLKFAGAGLIPLLTPALSNAIASLDCADLTICLWDTHSTGIKPAPAPWREHYARRGEIRGFNTDRIYTVYEHESCGLCMLDADRNLAVFWALEADRIPYWVKGSPLRTILHWWMGNRDAQLVHSAAVGLPDAGVLITAKSGSGKSTTALSCLHAGMLYAGDDYVIVRSSPAPHVYSLYNTAKCVSERLPSFPELRAHIDNPDRLDTEKALLFLGNSHAKQIATGFPLKAILVPHVSGLTETTLRKISAAAAFRALAPSTIFAHPRGGETEFRFLAELTKKLPCYVLECGTEISQIPPVVLELLSDKTA